MRRGGPANEALTPTLSESFDAAAGATLDATSQEGRQLIAKHAAATEGDGAGAGGGSAAVQFPVESWDRYDLLKLLGQGGMGAVYKARDRKLGRIVALKFIRGNDEQMTARFLQEARTQSKIDHPGICKVHEVGEVEGKPYIAMQFVDGSSLAQLAAKLSLSEKVAIIRDAAIAMHAAHELGIIHRDIKAANVTLERETRNIVPRRGEVLAARREESVFKGAVERKTEGRPAAARRSLVRGSAAERCSGATAKNAPASTAIAMASKPRQRPADAPCQRAAPRCERRSASERLLRDTKQETAA